MNIDRTIAKLELKEMLNELLQTENEKKWTEAHLSQFLEYSGVLLPQCSRICFWKKHMSLDTLSLLDTLLHLAARIELKRGYGVIMDEDNEHITWGIAEHEFFSLLKSAILEKRFFIPQFPPPQIDLMETEILGRQMSFIPSENKTAFAKLIFDLVGLEDR